MLARRHRDFTSLRTDILFRWREIYAGKSAVFGGLFKNSTSVFRVNRLTWHFLVVAAYYIKIIRRTTAIYGRSMRTEEEERGRGDQGQNQARHVKMGS